jgi:hypothetical protein
MKVYCYDKCGYYTGECDAPENPRDEGTYLMPAKSTELKPPTIPEGKLAYWNDKGWELVRDLKGIEFRIVDAQGFISGTGFIDGHVIPPFYIEETPSALLEYPKWSGKEWVEGKTADEKWSEIRLFRNALLAESDFTQLADVPLTDPEKQAYQDYRQYLRDITETESNPFTIAWKSLEDFI